MKYKKNLCFQIYVNEGVSSHWWPYWRWCDVCQKNNKYDYVLDMHHMEEDKNYVFKDLGIKTDIEAEHENPTKLGKAAETETKKK